jgi:hypothetical protein
MNFPQLRLFFQNIHGMFLANRVKILKEVAGMKDELINIWHTSQHPGINSD